MCPCTWKQYITCCDYFATGQDTGPVCVGYTHRCSSARRPVLSPADPSKGTVLSWVRRFIHRAREVENYPRFTSTGHNGKTLAAAAAAPLTFEMENGKENWRRWGKQEIGTKKGGEGLRNKWDISWSRMKNKYWESYFVWGKIFNQQYMNIFILFSKVAADDLFFITIDIANILE